MNGNQTGRTYQEESALSLNEYFSDSYFTRQQLFSLAAQIHTIHELRPIKMLEVGKGNGFVSDFMQRSGCEVVTFDINANLSPNVVGNVLELEKHFEPNSFDLISCSEVLEHIPFIHFESILEQMHAVTKRYVFLTLPRCGKTLFSISGLIKLPRIIVKDFLVNLRLPNSKIIKQHHWELDHSPATSKRSVKKILQKHFLINRFSSEPINPYHQHIILQK